MSEVSELCLMLTSLNLIITPNLHDFCFCKILFLLVQKVLLDRNYLRVIIQNDPLIQSIFSQVINASFNLPIYFFAGQHFRDALLGMFYSKYVSDDQMNTSYDLNDDPM